MEINDRLENEKQTDNVTFGSGKIYEEWNIYVATFLGGPLVGGYMLANNFKCFGDRKKMKLTWIIAVSILLLISIISFLEELYELYIPYLLMPLGSSILAYIFAKYYQEKQINRHLDKRGDYYGWGRTILVSLIGGAFTVLILILFTFWWYFCFFGINELIHN